MVIQRHTAMHQMLVNELSLLGLELFVREQDRLPMLNSVIIPEGTNDVEVRSKLLNEYQIEIGGGLGPLASKIWRIGIMGETAKKESIQKLMDAFKYIKLYPGLSAQNYIHQNHYIQDVDKAIAIEITRRILIGLP